MIIAARTFDLIAAIHDGEHEILDMQQRQDIACILQDAARVMANAAQRLALTPTQAQTVKRLQDNTPKHLN